MDEISRLFMQYDYADTRSLCKDFLTLVSAILVFSTAFSEQTVDFANASLNSRRWLLSSWQCFIAAIVACGIGLCFITLAGGAAVYGSDGIGPWSGSMYYWAQWAWLSIFLAGGLFVAGLIALIFAGANTIRQRALSAK